jgi:hypothetical protein
MGSNPLMDMCVFLILARTGNGGRTRNGQNREWWQNMEWHTTIAAAHLITRSMHVLSHSHRMQTCNYASYGCPLIHSCCMQAAGPRGSLRSCCMRSCRGNFLHVFLIKMKI